MKKEDLVSKGLTEEHAQIAVDLWNEAMKGFVPKERLDEVSGKLKEANTTIETLKKDNQDNAELQKQVNTYKDKVTALETAAANSKKEYALKEKLAAAGVLDADYLIYNGTIDGQVKSISDLEAKSNLFSEFKAVKEGNVWYTGKNLYQATDTVGELIMDMHLMLTDGDPKEMTFLEKMK